MAKNTIGERITEALRKSGMRQRDLAAMVQITEVSLSRYISGKREPKASVIARIAMALHTTSDYLMGVEYD